MQNIRFPDIISARAPFYIFYLKILWWHGWFSGFTVSEAHQYAVLTNIFKQIRSTFSTLK